MAIFSSLDAISNNDYPTVNEQGAVIWDLLKKYDTWYLYDIRLINSILYLFPIDTVGSIIRFALKRLKDYKNLRSISKLSCNLQINYLLLLIKNREFQTALDTVKDLIRFTMDYSLHTHLASSYVEKELF